MMKTQRLIVIIMDVFFIYTVGGMTRIGKEGGTEKEEFHNTVLLGTCATSQITQQE